MNRPLSFRLGEDELTADILTSLAAQPKPAVCVSEKVWAKVGGYRTGLESALGTGRKIYGVNTGFGYLSDVSIPPQDLAKLQLNIIRSHACGVGTASPDHVVRALLILRAHTFALGFSAVRKQTLQLVLDFIAADILAVIPCQGSVGASGDLAPLSHLALAFLGEGDVRVNGETQSAAAALKKAGIKPLQPEAKEGLALINGTHYMSAIAAFAVVEAKTLIESATVIAALSLDAIRGTLSAFDPRIHEARMQLGQRKIAEHFRSLFAGKDEIVESHKDCGRVQDPYSFRCVPQVHGASLDTVLHAETILNRELNSVTDNPLFFEGGDSLSGGNFHGQPISYVMDFLGIAMAGVGNISERRTDKLTNPHMSGGLPAFLAKDSGLNSGFMIPQVVAAALASENKILCHPASADSIPTSADKEDHVSMGPIAARKARQIIENVSRILAIEILSACQGIDLLAPLRPAPALLAVHHAVRRLSKFMDQDRSLSKDFEVLAEWLIKGGISEVAATSRPS